MISIDPRASAAPADRTHHSSGPGQILLGVFQTLDQAGIPYCVLHGYENYPQRVMSDVDCMISANVRAAQLAALFQENKTRIGADLVFCRGYYFVFAGKNVDRSPCFLVLDLSVDYEIRGLKFYSWSEVLESRYRHDQFWVPAAHIEFGCYLIRKIDKAQLHEEQCRRLSVLYAQDPTGCRQQIARFWGGKRAALIASSASSGDWRQVSRVLPALRAEMRMRARFLHPWHAIASWVRRIGWRVRSVCWPDGGLIVALLGPDGAGKSSVIKAVPQALAGTFNRTTCYGFAPGVLRWLRPPDGPNTQPHAAPPRSLLVSITRALCYWLIYYLLCYRVTVWLHLAHATLVLHDRHLLDALVDPTRYRYRGPMWLLRLIWRFVPRPDLIILLDAPAEVLQSRKQEVSFAESERQRTAYRTLVGSLPNGHIIDAARPLEEVVGNVNDLILCYLSARVRRRFGLERNQCRRHKSARSKSGDQPSRCSARV
jgi:thymidylate kinase